MSELVKFDDWSLTSDLDDPVDRRIAHADYIRESYFKDGKYSDEIAGIIDRNLGQALATPTDEGGSGLTADQINEAFSRDYSPSYEEKAQAVSRANVIDPRSDDGDPIRAYNAFIKIKNKGGADPNYLAQEEALFGEASAMVDKYYEDAVDKIRSDGGSPFVRVARPDGGYYLKSGPAADGLTPYEAYKQSVDAGFLNARDIRGVQQAMTPFEDSGVPLHKRAHYEDAILAINTALGSDQDTESLTGAMHRYAQRLGVPDDRVNVSLNEELRADVVEELEYLFPDTSRIPLKDRFAAVDYMVGEMAMSSGVIRFDEGNLSNNVRTYGYGDMVMHGDLLAKKSLFEEAIKDYSGPQKEKLRLRRRNRLNGAMFNDFNEVINRTYLSSKWNEAVAQGLLDGKEESEIFDEFFENNDYNEFRNEFVGSVLRSVPDAFTDTVAALGVAATSFDGEPNKLAQDTLIKNQRDRAARARLANMMGDKVGWVTTLSSMIAPVAVDLTATAALTTTTGVGGAGYLGLKTGAKLTTKGIATGILAGSLKRKTIGGALETAEQAAERLVAKDLIVSFGKKKKSFANEATREAFEKATAVDVIKKYNQVVAKNSTLYPAMFVPAATRSGGMTYASVYSALPDDMPSEERHQKALGAGLMASVVTGGLVLGFRAIGMGGVEDFIIGRASTSQVREQLKRTVANTVAHRSSIQKLGQLPDDVYDAALAKISAEGIKRSWKEFVPTNAMLRYGKNFADEALEEGLDEFINSFIQTGFTGEDMPFTDRVTGAYIAAAYGGAFGLGMPLFRDTLGRAARGSAVTSERAAKREVATRIAEEINTQRAREAGQKLRDLDSPATADAIEDIMDERERANIDPERATDPFYRSGPREPAQTQEQTQEQTEPSEITPVEEREKPQNVVEAYARLGVAVGATFAQIQAAYRNLVRTNHPDVNPAPEAEQVMQEINEAWDIIKKDAADQIVDAVSKATPEQHGAAAEEEIIRTSGREGGQIIPVPQVRVPTPIEIEDYFKDLSAQVLTRPDLDPSDLITVEALEREEAAEAEARERKDDEDAAPESRTPETQKSGSEGFMEMYEAETKQLPQLRLQTGGERQRATAPTASELIDLRKTSGKTVHLDVIKVAPTLQQQGAGTAIMARLAEIADATGTRITLDVQAFKGGPSKEKLKEFYGRFGFTTQRGKRMVRKPTTLQRTVGGFWIQSPEVAGAEGSMPSLNTNQLAALKSELPADLYQRLLENKVKYATTPFIASSSKTEVSEAEHSLIVEALQKQKDKLLKNPPKGELTLATLNKKLKALGVTVKKSKTVGPQGDPVGLIFGGKATKIKNVTDKPFSEWVTEAHEGVIQALTFELSPKVKQEQELQEEGVAAAEAEEELVITEDDLNEFSDNANAAGLDSEDAVEALKAVAEDIAQAREEADVVVETDETSEISKVEAFAQRMEKKAEQARRNLREKRSRFNLGLDPTTLSDLAIIGAAYIARKIANFDAWTKQLLSDFKNDYTREELEPHLNDIFKESQKIYREEFNTPEDTADNDPDSIDAEVTEEATESPDSFSDRVLRDRIRELIHLHVRSGIPVDITKKTPYGFPDATFKIATLLGDAGPKTRKWTREALTLTINNRIKRRYPVPTIAKAVEAAKTVGLTDTQAKNLSGESKDDKRYTKWHHDTAFGVFNNHPASVAALLRKEKVLVRVPDIYIKDGEYIGNPAIAVVEKFDDLTKTKRFFAVDVEAPVAGFEFTKRSIVYKDTLQSDLSKYLLGHLKINAAFERNAVPSYLNAQLGPTNNKGEPVGDQLVVFDAERDRKERGGPTAPLNALFAKEYTGIVTGSTTSPLGSMISRILNVKAFREGAGVSFEEYTTARAMALAEVYTILHKAMLAPGYGSRSLRTRTVAEGEKSFDVLELDPEIETETLAGHMHLEEIVSYTPPRFANPVPVRRMEDGLVVEDANSLESKAAFLLKYGFPDSKDRPIITTTPTSRTLADNWAEITIRQYFAKEARDNIKYLKGDTIDLYAIIRDAGNRARQRLISRRALLFPDVTNISFDASQTVTEFEADQQDLAAEQDIDKEDLPIPEIQEFGVENLTGEEVQSLWREATMLDAADMENAVESVRVDVRNYLRARGPNTIREQNLFTDALKRVVVAVEGDSAPPHVLEQTQPARIFEHLLNVARVNHRTSDFVARLNKAVASEEVLMKQNWNVINIFRSYVPMFSPRKAELTNDIAREVLAKLGVNHAPSIFLGKKFNYYRRKNQSVVSRLGLKSGDPSSVIDALQKIAKSSRNRQHRLVAELLLRNPELLSRVKFSIYDVPDGSAGNHTTFEDGSQMVSINLSGFYGQGVESVLLHEYIHAFTVDLLAKPESELTPKQRGAKKRLEGLFKISSQSRNEASENLEFDHAMGSLDEFVATFFSSATFQRTLKSTQPKDKQRSLFRRIADAILDLFGVRADAKFREAFDNLIDFVNLGNAEGQTTPFGDMDNRIDRARSRYRNVLKLDFMRTSPSGARFSPFGSEGGIEAGEMTPEQEAEIQALVEESLSSIPPSVAVSMVDTAADAPDIFSGRPDEAFASVVVEKDGERVPVIYVIRENLVRTLFAKSAIVENELHLKGIMDSIIAEELGHIAEFKAIPLAELDTLIDTFSETEFNEFIDEYTRNPELRAALKQGIADNDLETMRQVMGEKLLSVLKRVTRGYTTQEDIAFYESSPSTLRIMLRYIAGVFRRMSARYNLKKDNPELAVMINRMAHELRFLANGGAARARHMPFDPRDPNAGFDVITRRFDASLNDIDENTTPEDIIARFQGMFDTLELPVGVFSKGKYKGYEGLKAMKYGDSDPRVSELKKKEKAFLNASEKLSNAKIAAFQKIRERYPQIDEALISKATGSSENVIVDPDFRQELRESYWSWRKDLKAKVEAGDAEATEFTRENIKAKYRELVVDPMRKERERLQEQVRKDINAAQENIRQIAPDLAESILELRLLLDAFSLVMKKTFGLEGKVMAKVESQVGIYLTRQYRVFEEEGFRDRIMSDKTTEAFTEAYEYMRRQWIRTQAKKIRAKARNEGESMTVEESLEKSKQELEQASDTGRDPIHAMMSTYLKAMEKRTKGEAYRLPKGVGRSLLNNLRRREQVPPPLQKLMGVYGPEEGINNLARSLTVVAEMTAKQAYFNNLAELGAPKSDTDEDAFVFTHEQLTNRPELDPESYVNMRTGEAYVYGDKVQATTELESTYDQTYNYYIHEDMFDDLKRMYSPDIAESNLSTSKQKLASFGEGLRLLTGAALTAKTLGSVTFYMRNVLGNLFFFAPAQGFGPVSMARIATRSTVIGRAIKDPKAFDEYYAELTGLNVIGQDLYSSLIRDLLKKPKNVSSVLKEIESLNKIVEKSKGLSDKVIKPVMERLQALSQSVDAFYKIGYYELEKENLLKAKQWDIDNNTDSIDANAPAGYRSLSDYDLKYLAAQKVRRTSQSYADAYHLVEKIGKSEYASVVTPFLRFKTEVFRILENTYKLARQEMKSTNPVVRLRGVRRISGVSTVILGVSAGLPTLLAHLAGVGEEEDELLRGSSPEYKRFNTFWYNPQSLLGIKSKELRSWDMTFVNPFAIGVDPLLRFSEHAFRGNSERGFEEAFGSLMQTFMDENIFLSSVVDVSRNVRSDTGGPIAEKGEGALGFAKKLGYVFSEAYAPRTPTKLAQAAYQALYAGASPDPAKSAKALLIGEITPVKPYKYDPETHYLRYLQRARDERNRASSLRNILKSKGQLSEGQIRRSIRKWIKVRREVDQRIYSSYIGAQGLGLTPQQARRVMSEKALGMGKRRQSYIVRGRRERDVLPTPFIEQVIGLTPDGVVGKQRLRIALDEIRKSGPRIQVLETID